MLVMLVWWVWITASNVYYIVNNSEPVIILSVQLGPGIFRNEKNMKNDSRRLANGIENL